MTTPSTFRPLATLADIEEFERVPWRTRLPFHTTYEMLRSSCEEHGDRIALRLLADGRADASTRDVSYAELLANIHRTANALQALGIGRSSPVSILLPNLVESHYALWGAQASGIASPINSMLEGDYIARICRETRSEVVIALGPTSDTDTWSKAIAVVDSVDSIRAVLQVNLAASISGIAGGGEPEGPMPARSGVQVLDFHAAISAQDAENISRPPDSAGHEPCAYFHTGGTTGYPKVAVHTHQNEAFLAWSLGAFFGERNVFLSGLPLFHVNGAMVSGLMSFYRGDEVILLTADGYRGRGVLDNFWAIACRFGATGFSTVPTIIGALSHKPLPADGVPTLRHALCGAAPLPRQVAVDFEGATGVAVHEGYGLTEGTCVTTLNPPFGAARIGTVGVRLPYQELRLVNPGSLERVEPGEPGLLLLRGPNIFPGYLRTADNEGCWTPEGWYDTGDLARIDGDGNVVLCGRAKDLIIRGGHNIDPALIEKALETHPSISSAAAVGQPDQHSGELPVAYVTLKPGASITASELSAHAARAIPERAAIPVRMEVLDIMPLTAVGKISKPELRLKATRHALSVALGAAGLSRVVADAWNSPTEGLVVNLRGPDDCRDEALAIAGSFAVMPVWQALSA